MSPTAAYSQGKARLGRAQSARKDYIMINQEENKAIRRHIPIFFAADDRYLKYLAVAISSLSHFASEEYQYDIKILSADFTQASVARLRELVKPNIKITLCDMVKRTAHIKESLALRLRDYYSEAIYYRMFIPSMFPELKRAVYLDSDIVLNDDVAKLYFSDIGDSLMGVVTDESVITVPVFCDYVKRQIGVREPSEYFNSGVLLMNLEAIRREKIEEKFLYLLKKFNFNTVAPDQDYLNFLCRDRLTYLPCGWNKHAIEGRDIPADELHLIHFNMFNKPWHYGGVPMEKYFWDAAGRTSFLEELLQGKAEYTEELKAEDTVAGGRLLALAEDILKNGDSMAETVYEGFFDKLDITSES